MKGINNVTASTRKLCPSPVLLDFFPAWHTENRTIPLPYTVINASERQWTPPEGGLTTIPPTPEGRREWERPTSTNLLCTQWLGSSVLTQSFQTCLREPQQFADVLQREEGLMQRGHLLQLPHLCFYLFYFMTKISLKGGVLQSLS